MVEAATKMLALEADVIAPDGCEVRILAQTPRGSMAHFTLGPGAGLARGGAPHGRGGLVLPLGPGPDVASAGRRAGDRRGGAGRVARRSRSARTFSCATTATEPLAAVAVTMPPWPGDDEAYLVDGKWPASVGG